MKQDLWFARLFGIGMLLTVLSFNLSYAQETGDRWKKIGPWGGDIRDIKVIWMDTSLHDGSFHDSIVVASYGSGVFIADSVVGTGCYWTPRNNGLPSLKVNCIGVRKLGLGDTMFVGLDGYGIYKTTNRGLNWERGYELGGVIGMKSIYAITIHPNTSWIAYATTNDGLWKTTNFGVTWSKLKSGTGWKDVTMHEYATQKIFASQGSGLYRSTDLGTTWGGPYEMGSNINSLTLAYSAYDTLYAGLADGTVKEVTFPGDVFTVVNKSNGLIPGNPVNSIIVIPQRSSVASDSIISNDTLYIGTNQGVFKSDRKGVTWTQVNIGLNGLMVNVIAYYYDRDYTTSSIKAQNMIFVGTKFDGFYRASTNGTGTSGGTISWSLKNDSISIGGLRAVSVSPINSDQVFAGGGYVTSTGVLTGAVYKSSNASSVDAVSWTRVLPSEVGAITGQYIKSIAQPWGNTNIVLAADSINGIYRSTDNGSTWSLLSNTTGATYVYFDPMHKDTAFAVRNNGGSWLILKSFDGGATFTALTQGFLYPITSVSMDSAYTQYLYVTTWGGGVYRSTNLGTTFTQINNGTLNLNVFSLSVNKDTSNLFIGTEFGLYRSNNRGTSWIDNNTGGAGFGIDKVYDVYSTRDTVWSVLGTKGHFRMDKSAGTYSWTHESLNTVEYPISYEASTDSMMFRDLDFIWKWTEGPSYTNVGYSVSESKAVYRTKSQVAGGTFPILNNGAAVAATANSDTVYVWLSDTSSAIRGEYTDIPVYIKNGAIVDSFRVAIHLPRYINGSTGAYEFLVDTIITDGTLSSGRTLSRFGVEAGDSTYVIQSASTTKLAGDGILFKLRVRAYALAASADSLPRAPHNNIYSADSAIFIWNGRAWPTTNYTNWTFTGAGAYDSTDFGYNDNGVKIPRQCGSAPGYIDSLAHFWFRKLPNMDYSGLNGLESSNNFIVYANPGDRAGTSTDYNDNNFSTERLWQYTKNTGRSMIVGIPNTAKITYPFLTYGTQSGSIGGTLYTGPFPEKEIRTGDAIGAFYYRDDSLVCAGWGTWDPAIGSVFTVWGDDDRTPLKDGFVTNEKLILKVYDSRYKVVWNVNNQTVKNGNIFFTDNGVSKFDTLEAKYYPRLLLPILAGWNLISSYLIPAQPEVENIFKSGVVGNRFILMKDENGLVYWPQIGLNQIINWDITKAYWVYYYQVKLQDHNGIYGPPVDITKNTINLHKGWNLLPYWGDQLVAPSTVLASIAGKFTLLKDGTGRIYWPEVGYCDIDNMWAGFGYEIFMTEAAVFKFPSSVSSMSIRSFNTGRGIPEITESNGEVYKYHAKVSPVSQVIGFAFSDYNMKSGDEIGVFTKDGLCVGSAKYRKNCDNIVVVIVFGDITVTKKDAKSGAADGDELVFKLFTKADGKEYTPVANSINWKIGSGSVTFKANTIGSVNLSAKGNTHPVLPLEFALQQNYPNPFNPATNIKYALPVDGLVKIRVYDMLGREIKTLVSTQQSAGYYTVEWDATNNMGCKVASGVYFYQIEASGFSKTFKMMLMK